jgi:ArsR family transcriptional regulator, arsenate/arsenite/antimonite-responsive transcriptional repressor
MDYYFSYSRMMQTKEVISALSALSHEKRLEIYRLLVRRGPQGYAAGAIAEKLGVAAPILSFHAKALEQAGLVQSRQEGRFQYYTANFRTMTALVDFLSAECCSQADESCARDCMPAAAIRKRKRA